MRRRARHPGGGARSARDDARRRRVRSMPPDPTTLWSGAARPDQAMFAYTSGDDRPWDARLLRWDVLGSLGHIEGLRASRLADGAGIRPAPRAASARRSHAVDGGRLTRRGQARGRAHGGRGLAHPAAAGHGERLHTGRSRNDQVACDLRLLLKDRAARAARGRARSWPMRCWRSRRATGPCSGPATPISGAPCRLRSASGRAPTPRGCSTPPSRWRVSGRWWTGRRSAAPPGTAFRCRSGARLRARALGFAGLDHNVATVQGGRGKLEAAALFWCTQLGHELAPAVAGRDPVQRRGVRLSRAAGRAGDGLEHHAAQAQSRFVRADPRPGRGARGRPRQPCSRSRASSPAATSATFSCSRSRSCAGWSAPGRCSPSSPTRCRGSAWIARAAPRRWRAARSRPTR